MRRTWIAIAGLAAVGLLAGAAWSAPKAPTIRVPAGTAVKIDLAETVSTKVQKAGDTFAIRLGEPLVVKGRVLAPEGTTGVGVIIDLSKPGLGGKPAKLVLAAKYITLGKTRIPLKALQVSAARTRLFQHRPGRRPRRHRLRAPGLRGHGHSRRRRRPARRGQRHGQDRQGRQPALAGPRPARRRRVFDPLPRTGPRPDQDRPAPRRTRPGGVLPRQVGAGHRPMVQRARGRQGPGPASTTAPISSRSPPPACTPTRPRPSPSSTTS